MPVDRFIHPRLGHSEKVTLLTDLEFRVWTQYLLSSDDFGVMRCSPVTLQSDNDHLANRPAKVLKRCLDVLTKAGGLLRTFTHQSRVYVYQHDWQKWQKVEYPRATLEPIPPLEALAECDDVTRLLFQLHPGGKGERFVWPTKKSRGRPEKSPDEPETSATNARAHARVVANGNRLSANGLSSEGGAGETDSPFDRWFLWVWEHYPEERRTRGVIAQQAFVDQLKRYEGGVMAGWLLFQANLTLNVDSHEWRVKGMAPSLTKYLTDGKWLNVLPAHAPAAERLSKSSAVTLGGAAEFLAEDKRGA
jgi:hypothetical protein